MRHTLSFIALSSALLAGCGTQVVNPVSGKTERSVMDEKTELAEGRKAHEQVLQEYGIYPDARVQTYVKQLGQKLAAQSHRSTLPWTFTVLDSPEVNAFALPGGFVYVTRGLMAYMNSEAELAGVIGHEIGHVTARHGAQRATKQQDAGLGVLAATVLGAVLEGQGIKGAGRIASDLSQTVAAGYIASYSREQELQADGLGAEYLARNQYDPGHMVDVISALKNQERYAADQARAAGRQASSGANWLSSHPSNDQRLKDIQRVAEHYRAQHKSSYGDDGRARYLQVLNGLPFGESADQGLTRGQHFYHPPLGFAVTAPDGWKIQNGSDTLALINPDSSAGLVVKVAPRDAGQTPEEIVRKVIQPTQGQFQNTQLNGLQASRFTGQRRNSQGQVQNVEATVVHGPTGQRFILLPSGRDTLALQRARAGLLQAENSFRPLSSADRNAARPWVLQTTPYPKGGFAQLARQSPLSDMAEGQLRLINGYYTGGEPAVGQPVKVVGTAR